jgi:hypothetical protein
LKYIYSTKICLFHKQDLIVLVEISLFCRNNHPISWIFIFTNTKMCPSVKSPIL